MKILNVLQTLGRYALELLAVLFVLAMFAFLIFVMARPALAAGTTATVTWTLPTTRLDGSALAPSAIRNVTVLWRRPGAPAVVGQVELAGAVSTATVPNLVCGDFVFTVMVSATSSTPPSPVSSPESAPSNLYATGINCSCPAPATNVQAT